MVEGGNPRRVLRAVREHYPVVLHGVSMSHRVGGSAGRALPRHARRARARGRARLDLGSPVLVQFRRPLGPRSVAASLHRRGAATTSPSRIGRVQERLGRRILIENVSSYLTFRHSTMSEWEFLRRAGRNGGLRSPARRQQRVRQRAQPRLRSARVPRRRAARRASASFISPDTATRGRTCSTRTITRSATRSGRCIARRCGASARSRRCSSATTTSRRSTSWSRRRGARPTSPPRRARREARATRRRASTSWSRRARTWRRSPDACRRARAAVDELVVGDARLSAVERLDIYASMYFVRIHDVLRGGAAAHGGGAGRGGLPRPRHRLPAGVPARTNHRCARWARGCRRSWPPTPAPRSAHGWPTWRASSARGWRSSTGPTPRRSGSRRCARWRPNVSARCACV